MPRNAASLTVGQSIGLSRSVAMRAEVEPTSPTEPPPWTGDGTATPTEASILARPAIHVITLGIVAPLQGLLAHGASLHPWHHSLGLLVRLLFGLISQLCRTVCVSLTLIRLQLIELLEGCGEGVCNPVLAEHSS